jgi:hypothetical protein
MINGDERVAKYVNLGIRPLAHWIGQRKEAGYLYDVTSWDGQNKVSNRFWMYGGVIGSRIWFFFFFLGSGIKRLGSFYFVSQNLSLAGTVYKDSRAALFLSTLASIRLSFLQCRSSIDWIT